MPRILAVNPGSTSTKMALFLDDRETASKTRGHAPHELAGYPGLTDQCPWRTSMVYEFLGAQGVQVVDLHAVVGRGGMLRPVPGGVYAVTPRMLEDLRTGRYGEHASNLGAPMARDIADRAGCPAFIVDPVVVDELDDCARYSGVPQIPRRSVFHALNQKSTARLVARRLGKPYEECRFIVAHLGGGITVGAHLHGRVVDVNNGLDGDGPFSAERAGSVPAGQLVSLVLSGEHPESEIRRMLTGGGGLVAHCSTSDVADLWTRAGEGDEKVRGILDAMIHQIAKEIASHGATLRGSVDRIIITGGMANNAELVHALEDRVKWIAAVEVVPGEREMEALAGGALAALAGEAQIREY